MMLGRVCLALLPLTALLAAAGWADTKDLALTFNSREELERATRDLTIGTASVQAWGKPQ